MCKSLAVQLECAYIRFLVFIDSLRLCLALYTYIHSSYIFSSKVVSCLMFHSACYNFVRREVIKYQQDVHMYTYVNMHACMYMSATQDSLKSNPQTFALWQELTCSRQERKCICVYESQSVCVCVSMLARIYAYSICLWISISVCVCVSMLARIYAYRWTLTHKVNLKCMCVSMFVCVCVLHVHACLSWHKQGWELIYSCGRLLAEGQRLRANHVPPISTPCSRICMSCEYVMFSKHCSVQDAYDLHNKRGKTYYCARQHVGLTLVCCAGW